MKIDNNMKFFVGDTAATKILLSSTLVWPSVLLKHNKITYTTTDGSIVTPNITTGFGANIISNEYKDGIGVITFDNNVNSIPYLAFSAYSKLTSVTIPDSVTMIEWSAFEDCTGLTSITIPDSVTEIGHSAFNKCISLTSITIPDSVTEIGYGAFYYCNSLSSVNIGNSVTTIGYVAFENCRSLTSVTIPDSVTNIGYQTFLDCRSLKAVYCKPTTPPVAGSAMFNYNASDRKIYVPVSSVDDYKNAQSWSDYADSIVGYDFNQ